MHLTKEARALGKELAGITDDIGEGRVPIEALQAFRKNPWAVLDDRTVVTSDRPNVLDKRLDMATLDITSSGTPFGLLKDGRLWVDEMIASTESVKDRLYLKRDERGRIEGGVFIDGESLYEMRDSRTFDFDIARASVVAHDTLGCVIMDSNAIEFHRLPDGKVMQRPSSFIVHGAITDPAKPMCVWGEEDGKWVAYVQLEDGSLGRCRINDGETVDDVAVFRKNIALSVKSQSGKHQLRLVTVNGTLETWEQYNHETPIRDLVWLDERILLGRHEGKLFVWDVRKRDIDMKPFEGEVVQGPVRHPDGRVMVIMNHPASGIHEALFVIESGIEPGYRWYRGKSILGGPYVLGHHRNRIYELNRSHFVTVHAFGCEVLESFRYIERDGCRFVLNDNGKCTLVDCIYDDPEYRKVFLSGDYKAIDIESVVVVNRPDGSRRLLAKVQLSDGRWQVADNHGLLGEPAHGIYGLRIVERNNRAILITWTARHRRELVDCICKAF